MERPKLEVADVFRRYGEAYRESHNASLSTGQRRVMTAIELCRTAALGGHMEQCDECGHQRNAFNSCRASARSKIDPFVLSKTDPHQEHDLPLSKTFSSAPKACLVLPTGKILPFRL